MRSSNCCWGPDSLIGYAEGELDPASAAALEQHAAHCEVCRAVLTELDAGLLTRPTDCSSGPQPLGGGDQLGRYVLLRHVGHGGMGTVWAAYDPELDRVVALKLIREEDSASPRRRARLRARLRREAQAMATLVHRNVVQVFDAGDRDGHAFVAMELVEGETFSQWASGRAFEEIVECALGAARGLAAAHAVGIVHRDVKPQNILVDARGRTLVSDFGLAMQPDSNGSTPSPAPCAEGLPPMRTDSVIGTPRYMAPEQASGGAVDARADQYAWCLVLAEALGAFGADAPRLDPREAKLQHLPSRVAAAVKRGLSAEPRLRFPTMEALSSELMRGVRPAWRRPVVQVVAAGIIGAVGLAAAAAPRSSPPSMPVAACTRPASSAGALSEISATRLAESFRVGGSMHAEETAALVSARLDAYARRWTRARDRACELAGIDPTAEARLACVDAALHRATELVRVLADGTDPARVGRAVSAVASLPDPDTCIEGPAPSMPDPEEREATVAAQRRLDTARGFKATGQYATALIEARAVAADTAELRHSQTRAEALLLVGDLQGRLNDPEAESSLWEAIDVAGTGAPRVTAAAWTRLVDVVGAHASQVERGLQLADIAEAEVRRAGEPLLLADLLLNRATVLGTAGRHEEAIEAAQQAAAMRDRVLPADHPSRSHALHTLGNALCRAGRLEEGLVQQRRALAILEPAVGSNHPKVAVNLHNVASTLRALDRPAEARGFVERSLRINRGTLGEDHPRVARTLSLLAAVQRDEGDRRAALVSQRRAAEIFERTLGADDFETGQAHQRLALLLRELGEHDVSSRELERARVVLEAAVGPDDPRLASMWEERARLALATGHRSRARDAVHRAVVLIVEGLGPDHPNLQSLQSLATEIEQTS